MAPGDLYGGNRLVAAVNQVSWRQARALLWVVVTLLFVLALLMFTGTITIPGVPPPQVDLTAYRSWVFVLLIILATKALLEVLKPVFHAALKSHVRSEADIYAHFKFVSYMVWATAIILIFYVFVGTGAQENGLLSSAIVLAAFTYVMQEPLLNFVGWLVLVTMRVYKLGDRIEMGSSRGYVVAISPMNTTIREFGLTPTNDTHTGRHVTIPNSQVLRGNVFNATKDTPFVWDQVTITVAYKGDAKAAETLLLEAAEDVVGPMMRANRDRLQSRYEFVDLREYVTEEPTVLWSLRDAGVDLTLVYFCPVFERAKFRTSLVKKVLEMVGENHDIKLAGAATPQALVPMPTIPVVR